MITLKARIGVVFGRTGWAVIGREHKEGFWGRTGDVLLLDIGGDCTYAHVVTNHRVTYFRFLYFSAYVLYFTIKMYKHCTLAAM